jgi:cbb3-type cytochrome c oxidase subunit III
MYHTCSIFLLLVFSIQFPLVFASAVEMPTQEYNEKQISKGLAVYKKSNCAFCHGWAGDGQGHPRSPGAAASLRNSQLDRESMSYIIKCGVIGGAMPYHDRMAYRDNRCIADLTNLKKDVMPKKGKNISANNMEALVIYLVSKVQGSGEVTFEQCESFYKVGSRNCQYLQ